MVSALDSGASGPGSSPGRGHCVECVLRQDTLLSQCLSPPSPTLPFLSCLLTMLTADKGHCHLFSTLLRNSTRWLDRRKRNKNVKLLKNSAYQLTGSKYEVTIAKCGCGLKHEQS